MALSKLWVQTQRPKVLSDVILASDQERKFFEEIVQSGSLPNLLLVGHRGTGKSSMSEVLINEFKIDQTDVLKINCSDEKIDAMRDKVKAFAYTMPMGNFKVVRLEEADFLSLEAQALLRSLMEEVQSSCRFIATANYQNKILPEIQDRFQIVQFAKPNKEAVIGTMANILDVDGVTFDVDDLLLVIDAGYPSIRRIVTLLEMGSKSGSLIVRGEQSTVNDWKLQLIPLLEADDLGKARELVCKSASREELIDVYRFLYDNLCRLKRLKNKQDSAVILIAQYQFQHNFVSDQEIQVAALFAELGAL